VAATFPLPRSSFKLLRLILIGYLHEGGNDRKPSGPTDVGRAIGLDSTIVSRNNAALGALGLLESAEHRKWRLTDGGVTVARALEYEAQDDIQESLSDMLRSNEYVQRVVTFVRGRGTIDEDQVVSHMAKTAGVRRTSEFLTGARALLELIYAAGLLQSDGDIVRVPAARREAQPVGRADKPPGAYVDVGSTITGYRPEGTPHTAAVTLHLNLSPGDLKTDAAADQLAARIKRLLEALASTN
jgi:hypothetical protein